MILIVEDESIQAVFLRRMLTRLGYATTEPAVTGAEAIDKAARFSPDLILMDIRLRDAMDGITAAGQIQSNMDVPVIYMTAFADRATVRRAYETKCYGFLEKPVDDHTLQSAIEDALERHRAEQQEQ
jgi:CheY-like chemotaxis protein